MLLGLVRGGYCAQSGILFSMISIRMALGHCCVLRRALREGRLCFQLYYCRTHYKAVRVGGRRVEDMCYERRRAEACVDESAHHALVNAGDREIV